MTIQPDATLLDPEAAQVHMPPPAPVLGRHNLMVVGALFFLALGSIWVLEKDFHIPLTGVSPYPHYLYQAKSFLQGRWDLDLPPGVTDIVVLRGKDYIVYPPFPAILLMPFVAIFGLSTSDILFTAVLSAINLPLLYLLFEQVRALGLTRRRWTENIIIALFCYYGSINLWLSLGGRMWFTAQITCMTFTLLALLAAFRRQFAWSGVLLGCAFFSRATVALAFPLLFYLAWQDIGAQHLLERFVLSLRARKPDWAAVPWRRLAPLAAVTLGIVLLFAIRNAIVFGTPFETGYDVLIQQRYSVVTTGPFNVRYIPVNIIANFFTFPNISFTGPFDRHPLIDMVNGGVGISVFFTTPLFLLLFWRNRTWSMLRVALWAVIGLIVMAVLLFHAAGYLQFGARYLYDGYPFAFLLLALNEEHIDWRFVALGLIGVAINLLGAHQWWTYHIVRL